VAIYSPATTVVALACVGYVLLLTPTGSLPSPRWRWWAVVAGAAVAVILAALTFAPSLTIPPYQSVVKPFAVPALDGALKVAGDLALGVTVCGLAVGAWSLVVRFRRARGVERLQLRWLAFAAALTGALAPVVAVGIAVGATAVFLFAIGVCLALLPLATGAAILRYRLYDLDRIISRTAAYGLLTVLLGGSYAGVVLGLGQLLGQASSLVVASRPWRWPRRSSRPAPASRGWWTGASTAAGTTPPAPSPRSAPACASRSTWTRSPANCWRWWSRRRSRPGRRCGCGLPLVRPPTSAAWADRARRRSRRQLPRPFARLCETACPQVNRQGGVWPIPIVENTLRDGRNQIR
jgi:hypothetical protein